MECGNGSVSGWVLREWDAESVVREGDVAGEGSVGCVIIEVAGQVGQVRLVGSDLSGDFDGLFDREVRGMGAMAEPVEDQDIESFEEREAGFGDFVAVGAVGDSSNTESEDLESWAVLEGDGEDLGAEDFDGTSIEAMHGQLWNGSGMRLGEVGERVIEGLSEPGFHDIGAVNGDGMPEVELEEAEVVESEDVIGVLVGVNHRVHDTDAFAEELLAQVGGGVDQEVAMREAENGATSRALIFWIASRADGAIASNRGDSDGRAGSEEDHLAGKLNRTRAHVSIRDGRGAGKKEEYRLRLSSSRAGDGEPASSRCRARPSYYVGLACKRQRPAGSGSGKAELTG